MTNYLGECKNKVENTSTGKRNKLSQVRCGNMKRRTISHRFAIRPALWVYFNKRAPGRVQYSYSYADAS